MLLHPYIKVLDRRKVFRVLDQETARVDLAARREVKYNLPGADLGKLRSLLDVNCRRLRYKETISTVRSIYFDDVRLSACRANLDGIGKRHKVRLRWYDSLQPTRDCYLEIKWRDNRVTGKFRLHLQCECPLIEMTYRQIINGLLDSLPPQYVAALLASSEPIALVEYQREHFASNDGCLRITLDYHLAFYDQTGQAYISTTFPQRLGQLVVVEGKTPVGRESELRQLLHPYSLRVGRCSKYVHACRLLGLIPHMI